MLVWNRGRITDLQVSALPAVLREGDRLVINNTKVIPARLEGTRIRSTGPGHEIRSRVSVNLDRQLVDGTWTALAKPLKRLKPGDRIRFSSRLAATVTAVGDGMCTFEFDEIGKDLVDILQEEGTVPLPPYISRRRKTDDRDISDYQSMFANDPGAVAAPTASLHFDDALVATLRDRGVETSFVTLHIASGTFQPVAVSEIDRHRMHLEHCVVDDKAAHEINSTRAGGGRIIPVGTAALRAIECASSGNATRPWSGVTDLFIRPGFRFEAADGLITNFHMPRTSLVILVSALVGIEEMHSIYRHAIKAEYRFLSYGDCNLLLP